MRIACVMLVAGCGAEQMQPAPATPPVVTAVVVDAATSAVPDRAFADTPSNANITLIRPMAMTGPYKSLAAACQALEPCGFSDMDELGRERVPSTRTVCNLGPDRVDPNAYNLASGAPAKLDHHAKGLSVQIASQSCEVPRGLRRDHTVYFTFVEQGGAWWRTDKPIWSYDYNDKYESGTMLAHWNDQPGRTFLGMQVGLSGLDCTKQAHTLDTLELMIRVEPGDQHPVVYPPLVVGQRFSRELDFDPARDPELAKDCKPEQHAVSLTETWVDSDTLDLTGVATWHALATDEDGALAIGIGGQPAPSNAGRYRFTR